MECIGWIGYDIRLLAALFIFRHAFEMAVRTVRVVTAMLHCSFVCDFVNLTFDHDSVCVRDRDRERNSFHIFCIVCKWAQMQTTYLRHCV